VSKTKYQRGLCVWHGCKNVGTVEPNEMQRFCQEHWQPIQQDNDLHEAIIQAARKRIANGRHPETGGIGHAQDTH
jgi:hypothetical protein